MADHAGQDPQHRRSAPNRYRLGRAILDRRTLHIHDIRSDLSSRSGPFRRRFGTVLAVPLLREGVSIGAICIRRREVRPFTDKQIRAA